MNYGVQMYSLRDITGKDMNGALREAARMGYTSVEFAGFGSHTAEEIRDMLDKNGLTCCGTHSPLDSLVNDFEETVRFHKTIGNTKYILNQGVVTKEQLDAFIDTCAVIAPKLRAEGIELGYHNHHWEFMPTEEGLLIHKELEKRCDIFFQIDTYWAFVAGQDPVATLERLGDRVRCIHLKDGSAQGKGCSLGSGEAPVAAVRAKALELGLPIIVESEGLDPTGVEEVERCIRYLETLE